jgi:hypothetical protein
MPFASNNACREQEPRASAMSAILIRSRPIKRQAEAANALSEPAAIPTAGFFCLFGGLELSWRKRPLPLFLLLFCAALGAKTSYPTIVERNRTLVVPAVLRCNMAGSELALSAHVPSRAKKFSEVLPGQEPENAGKIPYSFAVPTFSLW